MRSLLTFLFALISLASFSQSGKFYGVTTGGTQNEGEIFHVNADGTGFGVDKTFTFNPDGESVTGSLVVGPDGDLYGTMEKGGSGSGTFFKIKTSDDSFVKLFDFPNSSEASPLGKLVLASNGYFYGYANSTSPSSNGIYRILPDGTGYEFVKSMVNVAPYGALSFFDGAFYTTIGNGGSNSEGSIVRVELNGDTQQLFSFQKSVSGSQPLGTLYKASNGRIYGVGYLDSANRGFVYSINPNGSGYQMLQQLPAGFMPTAFEGFFEADGVLFGNAVGFHFQIKLNGSGFTYSPTQGSLTAGPNVFFYWTGNIATTGGVIWQMTKAGTNPQDLAYLSSPETTSLLDARPYLTYAPNGYLYGITKNGGKGNMGRLFKLKPSNLGFQPTYLRDLHVSTGGRKPSLHLTLLRDGSLIGATSAGDERNKGIIFKLKPDGTGFQSIFDFASVDLKGVPVDAPIQAADDFLYGITTAGDIYRIAADGSGFKIIYQYYNDDAVINNQLISDVDGWLYGLIRHESIHATRGTLFRIKTDGSEFKILRNFVTASGSNPDSFTLGPDGIIYGTTSSGGPSSSGVIYKINRDGSNYNMIFTFNSGNANIGRALSKEIFIHSNGNIYGRGSTNTGLRTIYTVATSGAGYTIIDSRTNSGGNNLFTEGPGLLLYGVESDASGIILFRMNPDGSDKQAFPLTLSGGRGGLVFVPNKQQQLLSFEPLTPKNAGDPTFTLNATASSFLTVSYISSNTSVATIAGNIVTIVGEGTTTITAKQPGNASFFSAPPVKRELRVGKINTTFSITSTDIGNASESILLKNDFPGPQDLITYSVVNGTGSASVVEGNKLQLNTSGNVKLIASTSGNSDYKPFSTEQEIVIRKKNLNLRISSATSGVVGGTITLEVEPINSTEGITYTVSNLTGTASVDGNILSLTSAGTVRVNAHIDADNTFSDDDDSRVITIASEGSQPSQIYGATTVGGTNNAGVIYAMNTDGTGYRVLVDYPTEPNFWSRFTKVVVDGNGKFYGLSADETLFELDQNLQSFRNLNFVARSAKMTAGSDGNIYGVMLTATLNTPVSVFTIVNGTHEVLATSNQLRSNGSDIGSLTEATNGNFYGVGLNQNGDRVIYEFNPSTKDFGIRANAPIISGSGITNSHLVSASNDKLYLGVSNAIFEYDPVANIVTKKVTLTASILGGLSLTAEGKMIGLVKTDGTTEQADNTYIFEYEAGATAITPRMNTDDFKKYTFRSAGFTYGGDGKFYTVTKRNADNTFHLLEYNYSANTWQLIGQLPNDIVVYDALVKSQHNSLVGFRGFPNAVDAGAVFEFDLSTNRYSEKYLFENDLDYSSPEGIDFNIGSKLYSTVGGFGVGYTAIQEYDVETGKLKIVLDHFDGNILKGSLALHPNGKIYGIRVANNSAKWAIFEFDPQTRISANIYTTTDDVIRQGFSYLTITSQGKIYGLMASGGIPGNGTYNFAFEFDLSSRNLKVLKKFETTTLSRLVAGPDDKLYGYVQNRIFRLDPTTGSYDEPYNVGVSLMGSPYFSSNGKMYGMTRSGGTNNFGFIFEFNPATNEFSERYSFTDGQILLATQIPMTDGSDNKIIGVTNSLSQGPIRHHVFDKTSFQVQSHTRVGATGARGGMISFTIKSEQQITFNPILDKTLGDPAFTLDANSSSDLNVIYSTTSDRISINASQVQLVKAGRVSIKAEQPGNDYYNPATSVEQSFCINPAKPVITTTGIVLTSTNDAGYQWYLNDQVINGATSKTFTPDKSGAYTVTSKVDDCISLPSQKLDVVIITGLEDDLMSALKVYPNPAADKVIVEFTGMDNLPVSIQLIDVIGRPLVSRESVSNRAEIFDLSSHSKGLYFIKIVQGNLKLTRKLVVK